MNDRFVQQQQPLKCHQIAENFDTARGVDFVMEMDRLPNELLTKILKNVEIAELIVLRLVSTRWMIVIEACFTNKESLVIYTGQYSQFSNAVAFTDGLWYAHQRQPRQIVSPYITTFSSPSKGCFNNVVLLRLSISNCLDYERGMQFSTSFISLLKRLFPKLTTLNCNLLQYCVQSKENSIFKLVAEWKETLVTVALSLRLISPRHLGQVFECLYQIKPCIFNAYYRATGTFEQWNIDASSMYTIRERTWSSIENSHWCLTWI